MSSPSDRGHEQQNQDQEAERLDAGESARQIERQDAGQHAPAVERRQRQQVEDRERHVDDDGSVTRHLREREQHAGHEGRRRVLGHAWAIDDDSP